MPSVMAVAAAQHLLFYQAEQSAGLPLASVLSLARATRPVLASRANLKPTAPSAAIQRLSAVIETRASTVFASLTTSRARRPVATSQATAVTTQTGASTVAATTTTSPLVLCVRSSRSNVAAHRVVPASHRNATNLGVRLGWTCLTANDTGSKARGRRTGLVNSSPRNAGSSAIDLCNQIQPKRHWG